MSSLFEVLASTGFGITAGILSGFLGIGGGAILPPLLVFVLGIEQHRAQGISLAALVPPVGLPAVLAYQKSGVKVHVKLVTMLIFGFLIGAFAGAWLAHRVPSRELRYLFSGFLLLSAWRAIRAKPDADDDNAPVLASSVIGVPIGLFAGIMSGLLGVGGGLVALPLLRRFANLGRLKPAVYMYSKEEGGLPWPLLAAVAVGFALGAGVGGRLAGRVNAKVASRIYAGFLALMAVALLVRG
jgi:uncharacterized protein